MCSQVVLEGHGKVDTDLRSNDNVSLVLSYDADDCTSDQERGVH